MQMMFTAKQMQGMLQLRRALQLYAGTLPEEQAREVAMVYPAWAPGIKYKQDTYLTYGEDGNGDPVLYRTTNAFTSAEEFPPDKTNTLYVRVSLDDSGHPIWSPPTGAHDAYNTGDIVVHNGNTWYSKRDGNTSEPGTDEWWEIVYNLDT